MIEMFGVFAVGIVIGMSIILFGELIFKMCEADKQLNENVNDGRKDQ